LLNPRSWQPNGDIHFTFNELVRLGTQYVLYPCIQPDLYKIWVVGNAVNHYSVYTGFSSGTWYANPGIRKVDLKTSSVSAFRDYVGDPAGEKIVDVNYEGELIFDKTYVSGNSLSNRAEVATLLGPNSIRPYKITGGTYKGSQYASLDIWKNPESRCLPGFIFDNTDINKYGLTHLYGYGEGYSVSINLSNYRESPTAVFGFANAYEKRPYEYYIWDEDVGPV